MRYALLLVGAVLIVGIGAQSLFEAMLIQESEVHVPSPSGPYTRRAGKLWASDRDRRSNVRSNRYWVSGDDPCHEGSCRNGRPFASRNPYLNR